MFRIDRNLVNFAAAQSAKVDNECVEAGAAGEAPDAAASATALAQALEEELAEARAQAQTQAREIINEAEAKAKATANGLIEDARQEVAALLLAAREQAEEERRSAWQEGYTEGVEEGKHSYDEQLDAKLRESDEQLDAKLREDDGKLKRVIEELYDERTRTYEELEEDVVELAIGIVRKVINPSEDEFGGVFELLIRNALKQISPDGKIVIRVSPAEYERFFSSGSAQFKLEKGVTVTASVIRDALLGECDCVIDTDEETVNAGLDSQLKRIRLAFEKADTL